MNVKKASKSKILTNLIEAANKLEKAKQIYSDFDEALKLAHKEFGLIFIIDDAQNVSKIVEQEWKPVRMQPVGFKDATKAEAQAVLSGGIEDFLKKKEGKK